MAFCLPIALLPLIYPAPPTPKTEFQNLPAEIKLLIVDQLDHDTLALSRVAACNRELYDMAMPALYAHVSLGAPPHYRIWPGLAWPADRRSVRCLYSMNYLQFLMLNMQIERFLLTVLRKPHLARLVKSLDLTDLYDLCDAHRQISTQPLRTQLTLAPLSPEDHRIIRIAGMKLPLKSTVRDSMHRALEPNVPRSDALLAVLLGYLPSLERLEIPMESDDPPRDPATTDWSLIERVLICIAGIRSRHNTGNENAATLSKLTYLKAEVDGTFPSADVDWLMVLLRIPTLTHVFGTKWTNQPEWWRPVHREVPRLVHLELRDCTFDANNLRSLLKLPQKLETFIYERGWTKRKDWILKSADLSQALQYPSQTLAYLELSFNRSARKVYADLYLQPLNLTGLRHLKRLRISAGYLVQTQAKMSDFEGRYWMLFDQHGAYNSAEPLYKLLPQSLEELHVFQFNDGLDLILVCKKLCESLHGRAVSTLLEDHQFQHLKDIKLEAPFEDKGVFLFHTLSEVTNRAGVKLTTIENSADHVKSWFTGDTIVACADKKIDWGFDGEIQWAHPFTRRGEVNYDLN
ncbi:hypothetical protein N7447_001474 [Penicillium robsamsonii]|uniref:uncharacterized protein n=1 Tax=Penicillium robsamsonii TaxID=1792511 RepID=UPI0025479F5F|nr:uncharacterized protein N7447_001474 [Penicillium robsamsonii]KAJ5835448.1 hypothetical protein N7447_001474 [Penicillium robsamsonii]